jgi:hypothetical protein
MSPSSSTGSASPTGACIRRRSFFASNPFERLLVAPIYAREKRSGERNLSKPEAHF